MGGVWFSTGLFLYLVSCAVFAKAEECVTYNFENDVDNLFLNDTGLCQGLQLAAWNVKSCSEVGIDSPSPDSGSFISAASSLSCGTTFGFTMTAGGTLEVNVYVESDNYMTDQITVVAMQDVAGGNDAVVGTVGISAFEANFVNGWRKLSMSLVGTGSFQGYLSIMGMGSASSLVLVDSFRYIPPSLDEDSCKIYEDSITESTSHATTDVTEIQEETATETQATTQETDAVDECVTYNFESDFDVSFTNDNYLCDSFLPWYLDNYTSIDVASPNSESTLFMVPFEATSCISSFIFKMEPEGIVEANVFMDPVQELDHIIIIAQRVTDKEYDTVAGFIKYHPGNQIFVPGWNVIRFSLLDSTSFDGYLLFIGSADSSSTVLVDAVRYIPPQTPPEDASCNLY